MLSARILVGAAAIAGLAACGGGTSSTSPATSSASAGTAGVNLGSPSETIKATDQLKFSPSSTTAHVGDVIQWMNSGTVTHTVTFDSFPSLSDPSLSPGGTWEVKFNAAGTYAFHCTIHPGMTGTITVS